MWKVGRGRVREHRSTSAFGGGLTSRRALASEHALTLHVDGQACSFKLALCSPGSRGAEDKRRRIPFSGVGALWSVF